jgi:hypothetical protein
MIRRSDTKSGAQRPASLRSRFHVDLRKAVAAALADRPVPTPWPEAVGCLLPEPAVE